MTKKLEDYRNCKFFTKVKLNSVLQACGEEGYSDLSKVKKETLVQEVKDAQEKVIAKYGELYPGES